MYDLVMAFFDANNLLGIYIQPDFGSADACQAAASMLMEQIGGALGEEGATYSCEPLGESA